MWVFIVRNATCKTMKYDVIFYFLKSDLEHGGPEEDVTDAWGNGPKTGGGGLMSINICDRTIQVRHVDMTEVLANIENNPETEENEEKKE